MKVAVKVIAGAKKREMRLEGSHLRVRILARPVKGRANEELVAYIADVFKVRKHDVVIVAGEKETRKVLSIPLEEEEFLKIAQGLLRPDRPSY